MKFDMVIPTYKRKEKLERCLNSIIENDLKFLDIYIYFDNNNIKSEKYIKEKFPFVHTKVMTNQYRAFGIWNYHLFHYLKSTSSGMIYVCDDIVFLPNTLLTMKTLFEQICKDTDGVLTFNQYNLTSASKYAMGLIGKKFIDRFPYSQCFCPDYVSFYADAELGVYAKSIGKFYFGSGCRIHHYHPSFYKQESDEAHKIVRDKNSIVDRQINIARRRANLLWGKNFTLIRKKKI